MKKGIFIVGTDTDIGKTYVSALVAKTLQKEGFNTGYYKAALSGAEVENGELVPGDAKYVIEIAGLNENISEAVSYVFQEAVSPHLAAEKEKVEISLEKIKKDFINIKNKFDHVVVEGSGGIICPIYLGEEDIFLEDIIKFLDLDVILVADAGLGTINHTMLTINYMKSKGINIRGIILNNYDENIEMHRDNEKMICRLSSLPIIDRINKNSHSLNIKAKELLGFFGELS